MKAYPLIALILLSGCTTSPRDSTQDVKQFYLSWMKIYTDDASTPDETTTVMQRYVARQLVERLNLINTLYEQEIVGSDYFMYVQDYAPEWIPLLRVGQAHPFLGGEKMDVQLGTESIPVHLEVYTRKEDDHWKIYRVRDVGNHYEHPVYSAGDIERAKAWSAKLTTEYGEIKK